MAAEILAQMLGVMPEVRKKLVAVNLRIAIIGEHEVTTDIPEYEPLKQMCPNRDYDTRTRGIGAMTAQFPITNGAEENLLCYPTDRYRGENTFVHEFSHTIKALGPAETRIDLPRSVLSSIAARGKLAPPRCSSLRSLRRVLVHSTAARISGAWIRPSWSASIISRLRSSNSMPRVGQASATQSF